MIFVLRYLLSSAHWFLTEHLRTVMAFTFITVPSLAMSAVILSPDPAVISDIITY